MTALFKHFGAVAELAYLGLMTNVLLTAACLPVVVLLLTTDPARSWPLLALAAPLCAPGVSAAFAVLGAYSKNGSVSVVRTFVQAWRACARRALGLGAAASAALVVLGVDARAAWGRPVGAVALPVLVVAMILVVATTLLALVVLAERPAARLRDACRASVYLAVRHWALTLLSLMVLALFEALLATRPAVALGLAAAPLLYVIWAGSRFSLTPALGRSPTRGPS